jgi:hypothetical protein
MGSPEDALEGLAYADDRLVMSNMPGEVRFGYEVSSEV